MFILGFKDFFRNRKSVWQALVSLFFARARPRNFSLRSWQKKKPAATFRDLRWSISKNSWLSSYEPLQQYFHMVLFILKDLLGNTLPIFFVDSWFYQQLRVKESTLDLQTGEFRRKTTHLLLDKGDAWPSMGIYSDSRSSWKKKENDKQESKTNKLTESENRSGP